MKGARQKWLLLVTETRQVLCFQSSPHKFSHETVRMLVVVLPGRHQMFAKAKEPYCADLNVCKRRIQCIFNRLFTSS